MLNVSQKATICKQHNLTEEYINPDKSKKALICRTCIDQYFGILSISKTDYAHQSIKELMPKSKLKQQVLTQFLQLLHQKRTQINDAFDEIIFQVRSQLESIKDIISKSLDEDQMIKYYMDKNLKDNVNLSKQIQEQFELLKNELCIAQLTESYEKLQSINLNLEQVEEVKEVPKQEDVKLLQQADVIKTQQQEKKVLKYEYKLLENFSKKQNEICLAIAINGDGTIVITGSQNLIKVFDFINNQLKEVQFIKFHSKNVKHLKFMNKSDSFISCDANNKLIIWEQNKDKQWINVQELSCDCLSCLTVNLNDDLIILANENNEVCFHVFKEKKWIQEQKIETQSNIISLSLNDSSNELLCCSDNQVILILNKKESQWVIKQKIELLVEGFGVSYLNDNNFIFQQSDFNQLIFFSRDIVKQQFKQTTTLKLNDDENDCDGSFFPIHFIRQKGILLAKNGKYLFILRELANMEFVLDQQILFNSYIIYGSISNDGINLLTWDNSTKEYQIRILVEEQ